MLARMSPSSAIHFVAPDSPEPSAGSGLCGSDHLGALVHERRRNLDRGWVAQDIEDGAMAVHRLFKPAQVVFRSRALERHHRLDALESGPDVFVDRKETRQINQAVELYRNA